MKPIYVKPGPKELCGAEIIQALKRKAESKGIAVKIEMVDRAVTSPKTDKLLSRVAIVACIGLAVMVLIGVVRAWVM